MKQLRFGRMGSGPDTARRAVRWLPALACGLGLVLAGVASGESTFTFVDLQPKATQSLSEDQHGAGGNNWERLPRGEQMMAGARFRIGEKMIHLRSEHVEEMPAKVEGIKVDATFDRLHILHSTGYGEVDPLAEDGTEIGAYVVHYADNTTERIPIRYGEDLRDWWDWNRTETKRAKVAWTGTNTATDQGDHKIRLYAVVWENPHPEKTVTTIDVESKETQCDPFVIALSLEKLEKKQ
jgi:hypothetical protein